MDTALVVLEQPALPAELAATLGLAADFAKASKAKATQDAYASDWRIFESWCRARGLSALPASAAAVCGFLADEASAGRRASTLGRRLAAIRYCHRAAGTVAAVLATASLVSSMSIVVLSGRPIRVRRASHGNC
jgi:hypothetical protein